MPEAETIILYNESFGKHKTSEINTQIKNDLSLSYAILAYLNLDDHTYTHLSSRACEGDAFYIYPFGLRFDEVASDQLIKVTLDGQIIEGREYQYNKTGYIIHGSIYKARPDIKSVFHIHSPEIVAVSSNKFGLKPHSQWALHFYEKIAYHQYNSLALSANDGKSLINDLGELFVMLLRNHGSITCGRTIKEAMFYTYHLHMACKTQCLMSSFPENELIYPNEDICVRAVEDLLTFEKDLGDRDWEAWKRLISRLQKF